jgi:hypothetical protein
MVTWTLAVLTALPNTSCTATCTAGTIATPAVASEGCVTIVSRAAAAALTVKAPLVALARSVAVAVSV